MTNDIESAYRAIAEDPKYQHFAMIPERIIRCVEYFRIKCYRVDAKDRLLAYYLFIGVVDHAIDSGDLELGSLVLKRFTWPPCFDDSTRVSPAVLMTEILKTQIEDKSYRRILRNLRALYQQVVRERMVTSIESYIEQRRSVGRLTAKLSYLLICPLLEGEHKELGEFMEQIGEIGCLIDSVIDLNSDGRLGLLSFKPTRGDFVKLVLCTLRDGAALSLRYPRLFGLFVQSINDNIQDLFRRTSSASEHQVVSQGKDVATSVA